METLLNDVLPHSQREMPTGWSVLTPGLNPEFDRKTLQLIADGLSVRDIADLLMLPEPEIERTIRRLCAAYGAASLAQLRRWYSLS